MQTAIKKTISWRAVALVDSFIITTAVYQFDIDAMSSAGLFVAAELATKSALYYTHERVWEKLLTSEKKLKKILEYTTRLVMIKP